MPYKRPRALAKAPSWFLSITRHSSTSDQLMCYVWTYIYHCTRLHSRIQALLQTNDLDYMLSNSTSTLQNIDYLLPRRQHRTLYRRSESRPRHSSSASIIFMPQTRQYESTTHGSLLLPEQFPNARLIRRADVPARSLTRADMYATAAKFVYGAAILMHQCGNFGPSSTAYWDY